MYSPIVIKLSSPFDTLLLSLHLSSDPLDHFVMHLLWNHCMSDIFLSLLHLYHPLLFIRIVTSRHPTMHLTTTTTTMPILYLCPVGVVLC
jgi:hypothetical protein